MPRLSLIELHKESMKFSSGHFTIFSPTHRENLHGHNYTVYCGLETWIGDNGLEFDYRFYRTQLNLLCKQLNGLFLLAGNSPHLKFEEHDDHYWVHFGKEKLFFYKRDVIVLPITNVTVEELSYWFMLQLSQDKPQLCLHQIQSITVKIASSPGQSGSASWKNDALG